MGAAQLWGIVQVTSSSVHAFVVSDIASQPISSRGIQQTYRDQYCPHLSHFWVSTTFAAGWPLCSSTSLRHHMARADALRHACYKGDSGRNIMHV